MKQSFFPIYYKGKKIIFKPPDFPFQTNFELSEELIKLSKQRLKYEKRNS